jgi:ABC-type Zn uptake system ZnuABC Zn-binding protein ZnuA
MILKLGEQTLKRSEWVFDFSFPAQLGHPNPHLWLNVAYAMTYTSLIRDQLSKLDPANHLRYHRNATRYLSRLRQLDHCISNAIKTIPLHHRKLLTYHDAWPYFARRYGLTVAKIAAETGVRYVNALRDDMLPGVQGEKRHSYAGMMIDNVTTIVEALGGNPQSLTACLSTPVSQVR